MLYPVCPTCGFLLADKELEYIKQINKLCESKENNETIKDDDVKKILNNLNINKYCCRLRLTTYVDLVKTII